MEAEKQPETDGTEHPNEAANDVSTNEAAPADPEGDQSGRKRGPLWRREVSRAVRTRAFLFPLLIGVALSVLIGLLPLESLFLSKDPSDFTPTGRIVYDLSSYVGYQHTIKFRLYVATTNTGEKRLFKEKLPAVKAALESAGNLPEFEKAIREENLNVLEMQILSLIHDVTDLPLKQLKIGRIQLD